MRSILTKPSLYWFLVGLVFLPLLSIPLIFPWWKTTWDSLLLTGWFINSLLLTSIVTFFVLMGGMVVGLLLSRLEGGVARVLILANLLPLTIPGWFKGMIWNRLFETLPAWAALLVEQPLLATAWVHFLNLVPWSFMIFYAHFRLRSPHEEHLYAGCHSRWFVISKVHLPRILPSCVIVGLIVSISTWSDYSISSLLGLRTLTVAAYELWLNLGKQDSAMAPVLLLLGGVFLFGFLPLTIFARFPRHIYHDGSSYRFPSSEVSYKYLRLFVCTLYPLLGFILPVLQLGYWWHRHPQVGVVVRKLLIQSFSLGIQGMSVVLGCAVLLYLLHDFYHGQRRHMDPGSSVLDRRMIVKALALLGYTLPPTLLGLSVLFWAYSGEFDLMKWFSPANSSFHLIWSMILHYFIFFIFFTWEAQSRLSPEFGRICYQYNVPRSRLWFRFMGPMMRPYLLSAAMLTLISGLQDLELTLLLQPYSYDTITLALYRLGSADMMPATSLQGFIMILFSFYPVVTIGRWLAGREVDA